MQFKPIFIVAFAVLAAAAPRVRTDSHQTQSNCKGIQGRIKAMSDEYRAVTGSWAGEFADAARKYITALDTVNFKLGAVCGRMVSALDQAGKTFQETEQENIDRFG